MQFLIDRGIDMTIRDYRWGATAQGWAYYAANDEKMAQWLRRGATTAGAGIALRATKQVGFRTFFSSFSRRDEHNGGETSSPGAAGRENSSVPTP